jgi:hypothetical protein
MPPATAINGRRGRIATTTALVSLRVGRAGERKLDRALQLRRRPGTEHPAHTRRAATASGGDRGRPDAARGRRRRVERFPAHQPRSRPIEQQTGSSPARLRQFKLASAVASRACAACHFRPFSGFFQCVAFPPFFHTFFLHRSNALVSIENPTLQGRIPRPSLLPIPCCGSRGPRGVVFPCANAKVALP